MVNYPENSSEEKYASLLTPYAFKYVSQQLEMVKDVISVAVKDVDVNAMYMFKSSNNQYCTVENSCSCIFYNGMGLPCKHILAVRELLNITIFEPELCNIRWSKNFYLDSYSKILGNGTCHLESHLNTTQIQQRSSKVLSYNEKYRKTVKTTQQLTALISELSSREYNKVLGSIALINDILGQGGHFIVCEVTMNGDDDISDINYVNDENNGSTRDPHNATDNNRDRNQNECHGE